MALSGNDSQKLLELCGLTYKEQLVWFLNATWDTIGERDAENFWRYAIKCAELDLQKKNQGTALDEMNAHVFLEHFNETMTVRAMREKLRDTGAIGPAERPKNVPITHVLLFKYNVDWHKLVNASQGDNQAEIEEAQRKLDIAKRACDEAIAREADARRAAAEAAAAKAELEAALADLKAQEDAYNAKTAELQRKTEEGGVVARNKAKNELAQHLAEDPLPLRKAKITAEAAAKKAEKARAPFEAATKQAEEARAAATASAQEASRARSAAEQAREAAEQAKAAADHAVDEARQRVEEAEAYLNEIKSRPGCAHGAMWWMQRELDEAKKYLPESKGGVRRK